jgi:hypothetical protein
VITIHDETIDVTAANACRVCLDHQIQEFRRRGELMPLRIPDSDIWGEFFSRQSGSTADAL